MQGVLLLAFLSYVCNRLRVFSVETVRGVLSQ